MNAEVKKSVFTIPNQETEDMYNNIFENEKEHETMKDMDQQEETVKEESGKKKKFNIAEFLHNICTKYSIALGIIAVLPLPLLVYYTSTQSLLLTLLVTVVEIGMIVVGWNYGNENKEVREAFGFKQHWLPVLLFIPAAVFQTLNLWSLIFIPAGFLVSYYLKKNRTSDWKEICKETCMELAAAYSICFVLFAVLCVVGMFFAIIYFAFGFLLVGFMLFIIFKFWWVWC